MEALKASTRVNVKNILFPTDFSEPSEAALPFAEGVARQYGAAIHAFHVLLPLVSTYTTPESMPLMVEGQEEFAEAEMRRVDAQLEGLPHDTVVERGVDIWPSLERAITDNHIDLIVLGTHGRTGARKLLLGSVAEEVFRRSNVPVLTIGPEVRTSVHHGGRFRHVLFATDFTPESLAAAPYAVSMAQENLAGLTLLNVIRQTDEPPTGRDLKDSVANAMHELYELVPPEAELWCRPEPLVRYGEPADKILEEADERGADLIVLGVRSAGAHMGAATHLGRTTAHKVVVHAKCPVLTVRG